MVRKILFVLFTIHYSLFTLAIAASAEATVNTQEVVKGNPVQLRIKAIGGSAAFPNISEINGVRVTSSGSSTQSSMSITIGGMKSESSTVKKYIFVPKYDMIIPSYVVNISGKNYKTKPINIKVVESQVPEVQGNGEFSFVIKTDKKSVSVGESFVVTVFMSVSERLRGIQISDYVAPMATDFFIKEIAGQKEYEHNGYTVIEKKYIVTAKKEGIFTVSSASAKLGQQDRSRQDIFGRYGTRWMPIVSNTLEVEVQAQSMDTDLVGVFDIDVSLDAQSIKANKPVNLTVKIEGKGSLEDFILPKYEIQGVTVYSDDAKVESHIVGDKLVSSYSKSFAFISDSDFVIPARSISMYNPQTKETKNLEIASYEIDIKGKEKLATSQVVQPKVQTKNPKAIIDNTPTNNDIQEKSKPISWWMLALAFMLGALVMYLFRFLPNIFIGKAKNYKESDALKVLYAHISDSKDVEEMVRKLYAKKNGDKSVKIDKKELRTMMERLDGKVK